MRNVAFCLLLDASGVPRTVAGRFSYKPLKEKGLRRTMLAWRAPRSAGRLPTIGVAMLKGRVRRKVNSADRRRRDLRERLWPGSAALIWDLNDVDGVVGFATVPRLLPLVLHLIKQLAGGEKGGDPSPVYLDLW